MNKSITHFCCGGARHSSKLFAVLSFLLLSFLILIPGSVRAEGEDTGTGTEETSSTIFQYTEVEGGISITGFKDGSSVEDLVIPSEIDGKPVVAIGNEAFRNKQTLKSVSIPSTVAAIGDKAFYYCLSLTSATFAMGSQLTSIGEWGFRNTGITSIEIPSSVTTIGDYAFCSGALTSVTFSRIPIGENTIEGYGTLYDENRNLNTICVPKGSEEIYKAQLNPGDDVTFQGVYIEDDDHFYRFEINEAKDGLACVGYTENGMVIKDNVIPSMASGYPVTTVAEKAFLNHDLEYVNIPESIKTIGALAFAGNENLTDVELDGEDTQIAADAFQDDAAIECFYTINEAAYDKYLAQTFEGKEKLVVHPTEELVLTDETGFTAASRPTYYDGNLMTYERQLDAPGEYATLCLPFSLWLDQTNGIFDKVYVPMNILIHNTSKSTPELEHFVLMLEEQASDAIIPAGQPVFVKLSETENKIALSNYDDELLSTALQPKGQTMKVVDWDGTSGLMTQNTQFSISYGSLYQPKDQVIEADHIWSFNANGSFGPQSEGAMPPFRLFLTVEEKAPTVQAKAYSISLGVSDDSTTGIREIISSDAIGSSSTNASRNAGIIYDLNGRKVATASEAKHLSKGIYIQNGKKMVVK